MPFPNALITFHGMLKLIKYYIYASLNLGSFQETNIIIQLIERTNVYPKGKFKMLTCIFKNVSKIALSYFSFFVFLNLIGKGIIGL